MTKEEETEQMETMISTMYDDFMGDGFDFDSGMTFDQVFKQVFSAAVHMTLSVMEDADSDEGE